jgi:phage tail sheath protein FI
MAHRSINRGAWVAPANEILVGVLGLTQDYSREDLLDFQANAVNTLRNEPVGFMVLSSETLSPDFELSSINVRRLLSLLRRLALKHGNEYVFETNNEQFRRQVQQGFVSLLDVMFTRGAFAGKTPANSYQVVVSDALNHPRSVDQGRLIIELKVAPSQPLKFVTVRLAQTGGKSEVSEIV